METTKGRKYGNNGEQQRVESMETMEKQQRVESVETMENNKGRDKQRVESMETMENNKEIFVSRIYTNGSPIIFDADGECGKTENREQQLRKAAMGSPPTTLCPTEV